jgi:spermidine synthase
VHSPAPVSSPSGRTLLRVLRLSLFATGLSGIVAEYSLSTLAAWFLGDSVIQFTLVMSLMLFAMGLGSRWSRVYDGALLDRFIRIELLLSLLAGASSAVVHAAQGQVGWTPTLLYGMAIAIGFLIGLEIPLVMRIASADSELKENVSSAMEVDYIGSLVGGLLFAFVALPRLGMTWTPPVFGLVNLLVALALLYASRHRLERKRGTVIRALLAVLAYGVLLALVKPIVEFGEQARYRDPVIHAEQSLYHRIVLTKYRDWTWFYLNGHLQLSTFDEAIYHESMALPPLALAADAASILVLGGGDGCLARELLKDPRIRDLTLVDLDPAVTRLFSTREELRELNGDSFADPRLRLVNGDGAVVADTLDGGSPARWDLIYIDLPDPDNVDLSRLYTVEFYELLAHRLRPGGVLVTQATSPVFSRQAFVCILKTMEAAGLGGVRGWHDQVPTMGEWGWVMGQVPPVRNGQDFQARLADGTRLPAGLRHYRPELAQALFAFGVEVFADSASIDVNRNGNHNLPGYYTKGFWDLE